MKIIRVVKPSTGNYLIDGLKLSLLNLSILIIGGGTTLGIFYIVKLARKAGFPLPIPVWLIMIGLGIPCFIIWFQYGKSFAHLIRERYIIRGTTIAMLGDLPGIGCLYILMEIPFKFIDQEIHKIVLILLLMFIIMMPIMTILGTLDVKKAAAKK